jgi:hypothetical protein
MIKSNYKKLLLKKIIDNERIKTRQLINDSILNLQIEKIRNCIRHGIDELKS